MSPRSPSTEAKKLLENFTLTHTKQSGRVSEMESIVDKLDTERILSLNDRLKEFYAQYDEPEIMDLITRMTHIMNEITEVIHQVREKRKILSVAEQEIQERLAEIDEVVQMMKNWESARV